MIAPGRSTAPRGAAASTARSRFPSPGSPRSASSAACRFACSHRRRSRGVYLHLHGGGFVFGSCRLQDDRLERLALALPRRGRLASSTASRPEDPYPAAPDDCEAVALWLAENAAAELGSDRLCIGGESAGANLAVVTLLRLRDRHGFARLPRRAASSRASTTSRLSQHRARRRPELDRDDLEVLVAQYAGERDRAAIPTSRPSTPTCEACRRRSSRSGRSTRCSPTRSRWPSAGRRRERGPAGRRPRRRARPRHLGGRRAVPRGEARRIVTRGADVFASFGAEAVPASLMGDAPLLGAGLHSVAVW